MIMITYIWEHLFWLACQVFFQTYETTPPRTKQNKMEEIARGIHVM